MYESKSEHPFYKYPAYAAYFVNIPADEKVYELDFENERGHGPAYFMLIASVNNKYYIISIGS